MKKQQITMRNWQINNRSKIEEMKTDFLKSLGIIDYKNITFFQRASDYTESYTDFKFFVNRKLNESVVIGGVKF